VSDSEVRYRALSGAEEIGAPEPEPEAPPAPPKIKKVPKEKKPK